MPEQTLAHAPEDAPDAERLSALVDGDLGPEERVRLEAHLASCPECGHLVGELRRLKAAAAELGAEPPLRDLWPAIQAGVAAEVAAERRSWWRRLGERLRSPVLAWGTAAAALGVALVLGLGHWSTRTDVGDARRSYVAAIARLDAAARDSRAQLPPEARLRLEEALAEVDRAIADCERALEVAPDDPAGQQMLLAVYDEKVRVLNAAIELAELGPGGRP